MYMLYVHVYVCIMHTPHMLLCALHAQCIPSTPAQQERPSRSLCPKHALLVRSSGLIHTAYAGSLERLKARAALIAQKEYID
jgi:hypothetical protein